MHVPEEALDLVGFIASIVSIAAPIVGYVRNYPHLIFDRFSEKQTKHENNELLEEISRIVSAMADARTRDDELARSIAANERKRLIQRFSKQLSVRYISTTMSNLIMLVLFVSYASLSVLFANASIGSSLVWTLVIIACMLLALAHLVFMIFDLPFWAPIQYLKGRKCSSASTKEGLFVSLDHSVSIVENEVQHRLVDARPYAKAFKLPLVDSVRAFNDPYRPLDHCVTAQLVEDLQKRLPNKAQVVFVCSEFGCESREIVVKLRDCGYGNAYDLGEVATRYALFQRIAYQMHYLSAEES